MQIWRIILCMFFTLPLVFAASVDFIALVPGVALIVIVFLAATHMLATSISNPQLEAWTKTEIREFLAGVLLIGIVVALFISSQGVSVTLTGDPDYINKSQAITDNWTNSLMSSYDHVIEAATLIRAAASYSSGLNIPLWWVSISYQTAPLNGASIFLVPLSLATQGLTNAIFLTEAIRLLLAFFSVVMPKVLLPIAFSARLIPFTRRLGNTLVSLCLAGMVFFPAAVIMADYLNNQIVVPQPRIANMDELDSNPFPTYTFGMICESKFMRFVFSLTDPLFAVVVCLPIAWIPGAFAPCYSFVNQVLYPIISLVFQAVNALLLIAWEAAINPKYYGENVYRQLQPFLRDVSNLVMVIYLDIVFIIMVTIAGARSLSTVLGGEWYMAGIQRLI